MKFKIGDKVSFLHGNELRVGFITKIHAMGDMADVDAGRGDIWGIHFNRMKLVTQRNNNNSSGLGLV